MILPLRTIAARLLPSVQSHLFLAREPATPAPFSVDGARPRWIEPDDPEQSRLLRNFCADHGFGGAWPDQMHAGDARAVIALDSTRADVLAMAWMTTRPFFIHEIGQTLVLPERTAYLFGAFVAPPHRGRRLHRMLVNARLGRLATLGLRAVALCHARNRASIRSNLEEGYLPILRYRQWQWGCCAGVRAIPSGDPAAHYRLRRRPMNVIELLAPAALRDALASPRTIAHHAASPSR